MAARVPPYQQQQTPNVIGARQMREPGIVQDTTGQSLQQLGAAGLNLAGALAGRDERLRAIDDQKALSDAHVTLAQSSFDLHKHLLDSQAASPDDPTGFTDSYMKQVDEYTKSALEKTPNPKARRWLESSMTTMSGHLMERSMVWQAGRAAQFKGQQIEDSSTSYAKVLVNDDSAYEPIRTAMLDQVNTAGLPPEIRAKYRDKVEEVLAHAAFEGAAQRNPRLTQSLIDRRLGIPESVAPAPKAPGPATRIEGQPASVGDTVGSAGGADARTLATFVSLESGGNPNAKNPNSSASGLLQFTKATWSQYGQGEPTDPRASLEAGARLLKDNTAVLSRALNRAPQPYEQYLAHLLGARGATALLKADPTASVQSVVAGYDPTNAKAIVNNNGMSGMTAGQAVAMWEGKFALASSRVSVPETPTQVADAMADTVVDVEPSAPLTTNIDVSTQVRVPYLDRMSVKQLIAAKAHVDGLVHKDQAEAQSELRVAYHNAGVQAEAGVVPNPPDPMLVYRAVGKAKAEETFAHFDTLQRFASKISGVQTMTAAQMSDTLASLQPIDTADPEWATKAQEAQHYKVAANATLKARVDDPIQAAGQQGIGAVRPLNFSDPKAAMNELASRQSIATNMAERYGAVSRSAITKDEAKTFGEDFHKHGSEQQLAILGVLQKGLTNPVVYRDTVRAFVKDSPTTLRAADLALQPRDTFGPNGERAYDVAFGLLQGERMLHPDKYATQEDGKGRVYTLPKTAGAGAMDEKVRDTIGGSFLDDPQGYKETKDAIYSYYAYLSARAGKYNEDTYDGARLTTAIDAVAGSRSSWGGGWFGFGAQPVLMPWGMSEEVFKGRIGDAYDTAMKAAGLKGTSLDRPGDLSLIRLDETRYGLRAGNDTVRGRGGKVVLDIGGYGPE